MIEVFMGESKSKLVIYLAYLLFERELPDVEDLHDPKEKTSNW